MFTPKTWYDGKSGDTPIEAAELNRIEQGITESITTAGTAQTTADTATSAAMSAAGQASAALDAANAVIQADHHYLRWNGTAWPTRPSDGLPVMWVGGAAPDDEPPEQAAGDVWLPASGDGINLGTVLTALQLITASANTIPYFPSAGVAGNLTLSTNAALGTSDTTLPTQKAVKTYIDGVVYTAATNYQNGPGYTLQQSDANKIIEIDYATDVPVTVPLGLPVGFACQVFAMGTGQVSIVKGDPSLTFRSDGNKVKITAQNDAVTLYVRATNDIVILGALSA